MIRPHLFPSWFPRTLRKQFALAGAVLAFLIFAGGAVALFAMRSMASSVQQLSEVRLLRMQQANDMVVSTLLAAQDMWQMLEADSPERINSNYAEVLRHLAEIDRLTGMLSRVAADVSVLPVQHSVQVFRNGTHIVAQLREDVARSRAGLDQSLQERAALLQKKGDPAAMQLSQLLYRLRDAGSRNEIEELRTRFLLQAAKAPSLPEVLLAEVHAVRSGNGEDIFAQRQYLIERRAALQRFHGELQQQAGELAAAVRALSGEFTRDYQESITQLAVSSRRNQQWVMILLTGSLALAWLVAGYFMRKHVLERLQQVSHCLRSGDEGCMQVPVGGDDEIGEMAQAVEALLMDRKRMADANRELEGFSYSVAHDLRAPLRAIDGFSHLLQDEYGKQLGQEGGRYLSVISANSVRMGQLIDDLLGFSRLARSALIQEKVDMEGLARQTFDEVQRTAVGRKIEFHAGAMPPAWCDYELMREVWNCLLSNAVKFSRTRDVAIIEAGGACHEDEMVYYVKDNGVGFDMKYVDKLFGVFQRLHGVDEFEGTGIGLAIVKRIITRHGGRVWAEAVPGGGATIYFALPMYKEEDHVR